MGDNVLRHLIALASTLICLMSFMGGYIAGGKGWWWASAAVLIVYGGVYRIVNK